MTAETDAEFVERIESRWMIAAPVADITRLFALARKGAEARKEAMDRLLLFDAELLDDTQENENGSVTK